jgi:Fe-S cluster biogenesis protein NfuA
MNAEVVARVAALDRMLRSHAGGLELQSSSDGVVRLRFTGMCVGCELRPVTTARVVQPALAALEGVRSVEVCGGRVSSHAERALAAGLAPELAEVLRTVAAFEADAGVST